MESERKMAEKSAQESKVSKKTKMPRGVVYIIAERCKGCNFCIEFCPRNVLAQSSEFNEKGYHPPYVANPDECTNCQMCYMVCPEFAIFTRPVEEKNSTEASTSTEELITEPKK